MPDETKQLCVLMIDDDEPNLEGFLINCEEMWDARTLDNPDDMMKGHYSVEDVDVILLDLSFNITRDPNDPTSFRKEAPHPTKGLEALRWLRKNKPDIAVIVASGLMSHDLRASIQRQFPEVMCLGKPFNMSSPKFQEMVEEYCRDSRANSD